MRINPILSNLSINIKNQPVSKQQVSPTFTAKAPKLAKYNYYQFYKQFPDLNTLKNLGVENCRIVNKNCASGSTFADKPKYLRELKELGVQTIIDFRGEASSVYEEECRKNGFNYFNFNLNNVQNLTNPEYFIHKKNNKFKVTDKFVQKLLDFFSLVNDGYVYMGCQYGIDRTNMALTLNYLMNHQEETAPQILTWPYDKKKAIANKNIKAVKKIIKHLSPEQKQVLGINGDYTNFLKERIFILLDKNHLFHIPDII